MTLALQPAASLRSALGRAQQVIILHPQDLEEENPPLAELTRPARNQDFNPGILFSKEFVRYFQLGMQIFKGESGIISKKSAKVSQELLTSYLQSHCKEFTFFACNGKD